MSKKQAVNKEWSHGNDMTVYVAEVKTKSFSVQVHATYFSTLGKSGCTCGWWAVFRAGEKSPLNNNFWKIEGSYTVNATINKMLKVIKKDPNISIVSFQSTMLEMLKY